MTIAPLGLPRPGLTAALGITLVVSSAASALSWSAGGQSLWLHLAVSCPMLYFAFICVHDGVHGVLHRSRRVSDALGWVLAGAVVLPFPLLRSAHLRHHDMVGSPEDPEHVVYGASLPALILRLPLVPFFYLREVRHLRRAHQAAVALHFVSWGALVAFVGAPLVVGWLLPIVLAVIWFGFTTVYVPHCAHRAVLMRYFNLHSGYHDDHHRDRRYPFHQYFRLRLDGLQRHGMRPTHRLEERLLTIAAIQLTEPRAETR